MNQRIPDFWLRFVGIGLLSGLSLVTNEFFWSSQQQELLVLIGFTIVRVTLLWYLNRAIITWFHYGAPLKIRVNQRLAMTFLACVGLNTFLLWVFDVLWFMGSHRTLTDLGLHNSTIYLNFGNFRVEMNTFAVELFHATLYTICFLTTYELFFSRQDSRLYQTELARSEQEREKLRLANLQSQFDVLKQQVNPHFLFNALNSLSALISEDPGQAEVFVDKLSGVYRYILRSNNEPMATLSAELDFIDAYFHLLQTRHGAGLRLNVAVDHRRDGFKLPPLTLQLLVENAVKHNVVSAKRPLTISIRSDESGQLTVENNIQPKTTRAFSNGVGLNNIVAKYQILDLPPPVIEETANQFIVRLSLLACTESAAQPAGHV